MAIPESDDRKPTKTRDDQPGERRRFHRFAFEATAVLYSGSEQWSTHMVDISLKGVLLARPPGWRGVLDDSYRIEIRLEGGVVISMTVTVAHIGNDRIGFLCKRIDMDSFMHLKRLIELNLGDPELLNRELSALG